MSAGEISTKGRRRWLQMLPVIVLVYVVAYIDRTNISFALPHLEEDFGISSTQAGLLGGIFFFGYLILQIPGGWLAERWSAKIWIAILMVGWGALAALQGLTDSFEQLVVARFLLGVIEGGVQPALMSTIRAWFPFSERSRAYSIFKLYAPIASIITAPFAGLILTMGGWRELLIIQGIGPTLIALACWIAFVKDTPRKARWLSAAERDYIVANNTETVPAAADPRTSWRALANGTVWTLTAIYTLSMLGLYGIGLWLPTMLKQAFTGDLTIGLVAIIPHIVGGIAIVLVGRSADRRGHHVLHVLCVMMAGAVVLAGVTLLSPNQPLLLLVAMSFATASSYAYYGPFWAMVTRLAPAGATGICIGLINGVGNLGGFVGPFVGGWLRDVSGGMILTQLFFAAALAAAGLLTLTLRGRMRRATSAADAAPPPADVPASRQLVETPSVT